MCFAYNIKTQLNNLLGTACSVFPMLPPLSIGIYRRKKSSAKVADRNRSFNPH